MAKKNPLEHIKLKTVDELFKASDGLKPVVFDIKIDRLSPYPNQPFRPYSQEKLQELAEDIRQNGIYSPILVREVMNQGYQILAGHNRVNAAKLAGLEVVPAILKTVTDDEAQLIMLNTNLNQREELLPSEKAKAYKMQMEILKSKSECPMGTREGASDAECPMGTANDIAAYNKDNRRNVFRYIRLTYLISDLLEMVDNKAIPFRAGVELSYLTEQAQKTLEEYMKSKKIQTVTLEQSSKIRNLAEITDSVLDGIFGRERKKKPAKPKTISFKIPSEYFSENLPDLTVDDEFMKWIAEKISDYANGKR